MDVRSQISMVFHLDKCIGCHTCSIACKNVWTDRKGTEYMWWNNVETKPGTGYPTKWEDQEEYKGGWEKNGKLRLKSTRQGRIVPNIFHNPSMPSIDDYYEPWTYKYEDLFNAPEGDDQPTARPISMITGEADRHRGRPNWDDDLGGSPVYAENDPNLEALTPSSAQQMIAIERLVFFYLPRICNHCLNPSCVASCPSGALYKRGEDGIVLIDQKRLPRLALLRRGLPLQEDLLQLVHGQVGEVHPLLPAPRDRPGAGLLPLLRRPHPLPRQRALRRRRIEEPPSGRTSELVDAQRDMILDPHDPEVIEAARPTASRRRDRVGAEVAGLQASSRSGRSRCRRTSSTARCRCCSTCRRCCR